MKRTIVLFLLIVSFSVYGNSNLLNKDLYLSAGEISILSPEYFDYGMVNKREKGITTFNLLDVMKFGGHLCPGSVAGFLITQRGLKILYPKGGAERNNVDVSGSMPSGTLDIPGMILGAREHFGAKQDDFRIDEKLFNPQHIVIVLTRKDTGKSVKLVFHKINAFKVLKKNIKRFRMLRGKIKKGVATDLEIKTAGKMVHQVIQNLIEHQDELITLSK